MGQESTTFALSYIEIPLNVGGRFKIGDNTKVFIMAGPYIGIGIVGKIKGDANASASQREFDVRWGTDAKTSDFRRIDYGFNVANGVEIDNILIGVQYGIGLADISPEAEDEFKITNRVLSFSVGYLFGGK